MTVSLVSLPQSLLQCSALLALRCSLCSLGSPCRLDARIKRLEVRLKLLESEGLPIVWARPLLLGAMVSCVQEDRTPAGRQRAAAD